MSLGVLNNISAIYAQNNLANTQASLSKTLQQLSSGSRINSGADDAAGLSLANGLQASATALSQSAKNASEGVDFLQVADGALSQVTNLLNRAVTLATEASNGTLNSSQTTAADSEYQKILNEINTINSTTEYNGIQTFAQNAVFTAGNANDTIDIAASGGTLTGQLKFTLGGKNITVDGSGTATPAAGEVSIGASATLGTLANLVNSNLGSNVASVIGGQLILTGGATVAAVSSATLSVTDPVPSATGGTISVGSASDTLKPTAALSVNVNGTSTVLSATAWGAGGTGGTLADLAAAINDAAGSTVATISGNSVLLGAGVKVTGGNLTESQAPQSTATNKTVAVFTSDGTISTSFNNNATDAVKADTSALNLSGTSLTSATSAQSALTSINAAITTVAADRGIIGANINTLSAVGNVMTTQSTNTLAAQNDVTATDYGQATSDMSKYQILSQTGIAALAQANQSQQLITKLLQ